MKVEHASPIVSFVTLGAKNYSYLEENGNAVTKVRGFTLKSQQQKDQLNLDTMTEMLKAWAIDGERKTIKTETSGMRPSKRTQTVKNYVSTKVYRNDTFNKRYVARLHNTPNSYFTTVPFGCKSYDFVDAPHMRNRLNM